MKKIKVILTLCLVTLVLTMAAGCNLSDILGGLNESPTPTQTDDASPAPTQNDDEFELEGVYLRLRKLPKSIKTLATIQATIKTAYL